MTNKAKLQEAIDLLCQALHDIIMDGDDITYNPTNNDAYMSTLKGEYETVLGDLLTFNLSVGNEGRLMSLYINSSDWYDNGVRKLMTDDELELLRKRIVENKSKIKNERIRHLEKELNKLKHED